MATIRKQYKGFKIRIKRTDSGNYAYTIKDIPVKDLADTAENAHCFAMDDIEDYLQAKNTKETF